MKNGELYFRTTDDVSLYVDICGQGRPLVLCHGWLFSSRCWEPVRAALARHFRLITFDLRSHGRSQKTFSGLTLPRLAEDMHEIIKGLGLQNVLLGGWSLGGPAVLAYWERYARERDVAGLLLLDTTTFPYGNTAWNSHRLRNFAVTDWNRTVRTYLADPETFVRNFAAQCRSGGEIPEEQLDDMLAIIPQAAVTLYNDYLVRDWTTMLPTVSVPTLVMNSDNNIFPRGIEQGRQITALLPRGRFVEFEQAGHWLWADQPEKFVKEVRAFADKH